MPIHVVFVTGRLLADDVGRAHLERDDHRRDGDRRDGQLFGTLFRHAAPPCAIVAVAPTVVVEALLAALVARPGLSKTLPAGLLSARPAAVPLPSVAPAAHVELCAARRPVAHGEAQ
jgi:hypothetical protein